MKETGIIMSGNHPKLILDGIKTQTRRVITPQPIYCPNRIPKGCRLPHPIWVWNHKNCQFLFKTNEDAWVIKPYCPFGQVGDSLWVRETWATEKRYNHLKPSEIPDTAKIYYPDKLIHSAGGYSLFSEMGKVRSARFMCKWMSRAKPVITEVRVERLQKITWEGAKAEGIVLKDCYPTGQGKELDMPLEFARLWDLLNVNRGHSWGANRWVWVIEFKISKT